MPKDVGGGLMTKPVYWLSASANTAIILLRDPQKAALRIAPRSSILFRHMTLLAC